jgi:hypothetical protein
VGRGDAGREAVRCSLTALSSALLTHLPPSPHHHSRGRHACKSVKAVVCRDPNLSTPGRLPSYHPLLYHMIHIKFLHMFEPRPLSSVAFATCRINLRLSCNRLRLHDCDIQVRSWLFHALLGSTVAYWISACRHPCDEMQQLRPIRTTFLRYGSNALVFCTKLVWRS